MAFGKQYNDNVSKHGSTGLYLQLPVGESVKLIVVGEEQVGCAEYVESSRSFIPSEKEDGGRLRFAVNVWQDGSLKVLEGPETLYREMGELVSADVDLNSVFISIKKVSNKKYEVRNLKPLTDEQVSKLAAKTPHELHKYVTWLEEPNEVDLGEEKSQIEQAQQELGDDDIPF